jgi:heat shock protein HslJ
MPVAKWMRMCVRALLTHLQLALASLILLLVPCAIAHAASLAGSEWRSRRIAGLIIEARTTLFVNFKGKGQLTGFGGCNHFSGTYNVADRVIKINILDITRMRCADATADLEVVFLQTLRSAVSFESRHVVLSMLDRNSSEIASFAQTDWD